DRPGTQRVRERQTRFCHVKPCKSTSSPAERMVSVSGHPAQIPQADRQFGCRRAAQSSSGSPSTIRRLIPSRWVAEGDARLGHCSGKTLKDALNSMLRTYLDSYVTALVRWWYASCSAGGRRREPEDAAGDDGPRPGDRG